MINAARGEVRLRLADRDYRLCLTLGALAEIEHALGLDDLTALDARLTKPSARDLIRILTALLRGGGEGLSEAEVEALPLDARAMADAVGRAFAAAGFGTQE